jgi:hypothetical protein
VHCSVKMNPNDFCLNVFDVYYIDYGLFEKGFGVGAIKLAIAFNIFVLIIGSGVSHGSFINYYLIYSHLKSPSTARVRGGIHTRNIIKYG